MKSQPESKKITEKIKVRFAPSPTGLLHIGNMKIALLNYLFVRKNRGEFVLRIDDTDTERSTKESEDLILEDLKWIGIEYDSFYRQSERIEKYREAFEKLKAENRVYPCYETKEELSLKRKAQSMSGLPPVYDREALKLTESERKSLEKSGAKPYWRFKLNEKEIVEWNDLVHGIIRIPLNTISDPVIVKPDGGFVYTFASVVDDADIGITHIIRGDDHVTNTAAQIDIFNAICGNSPFFGHIPLMSSIDGNEVSKRKGSSLSIVNMRKAGILPEAIIDVLVTVGTAINSDYRDTLETLTEKFSFEKISLSSPKFNIEEIKNINRKIIAERDFCLVKDELLQIIPEAEKLGTEKFCEFWNTVRGNVDTVADSKFWFDIFYKNKTESIVDISSEKIDSVFLKQMLDTLSNPIDFDLWISELKKISNRKGRELFHPIRIVLTHLEKGPELRKIANLLGYENVRRKLENFTKIS